jgi:hypothetical protein
MKNIAVLGAGKIFLEKYIYLLKWLKWNYKIKDYKIFDLQSKHNFLYNTHNIDCINYKDFDSFLVLLPNNFHDSYLLDISSKVLEGDVKSIIVEKPVFTSLNIYTTCQNYINKIHSVNPKRSIKAVNEAKNYLLLNKLNNNNTINVVLNDGIPIKWNASYLSSENLLNSCLWDIGSHDFDLISYIFDINDLLFDITSIKVHDFSYQNFFCDFSIFVSELNLKINFKVRLSRLKSILPRIVINFIDNNQNFQIPLIQGSKFLKYNENNSNWEAVYEEDVIRDELKFSENILFLKAIDNIPSITYPLCSDVKFSINILEKLSQL